MIPQLVITGIRKKDSYTRLAKQNKFFRSSTKVIFTFEIEVKGYGDFYDYLNSDKKFNQEKLMFDILQGKVQLTSYKNMK